MSWIQDRLTRRIVELEEQDNKIRISMEDPELVMKGMEAALNFNDAAANAQLQIRKFFKKRGNRRSNR